MTIQLPPNAILIDTLEFKIVRELHCNFEIKDGMYYFVGDEMLPAAMIYPLEAKAEIQCLLDQLKSAKKYYDDLVSTVYYRTFPSVKAKYLKKKG